MRGAHPMLSPPLDLKAKWFEHSTAYTIGEVPARH